MENPASLFCREADDGDYAFLVQVDGSTSGVMLVIPAGVPEQEALDRAHRLHFTTRD